MGTLAQTLDLSEEEYRGREFADWPQALKGNHDLLCITQPHFVREIHDSYLQAGADILTTNSFTANAPSQADYGLEDRVADINRASAKIAPRGRGRGRAARPAAVLRGRQPGPHQPHRLAVAARGGPRLPGHRFRPARGHLRDRHARADGRRRRPAADRDHLRYAQRQVGAVRDRARRRQSGAHTARNRFRHDYRRFRTDAVGPDRGSLLQLHPACAHDRHRPELLAGARPSCIRTCANCRGSPNCP